MMITRRLKTGFTMIEVLVVLALFSIASIALFSSFAAGLRIWRIASRPNMDERRSLVGLERMASELRRMRAYAPVGFLGEKNMCFFPIVDHDLIVNVTYQFLPGQKGVRRATSARVGADQTRNTDRLVMTGVKDFSIAYYGYDTVEKNYTFTDSMGNATNVSANPLPTAMRLMLELEDGTKMEKTVRVFWGGLYAHQ